MLDRREFLQRCCAGVVGSALLAHVPTAWIPAPIRAYAARQYLDRAWRQWIRQPDHWTTAIMYAGRELFDAYERELPAEWRWTDPTYPGSLLFRGMPLIREGEGWTVMIVGSSDEVPRIINYHNA